ncbi:MAG: transcriptional repressor [Oscillibacter sp.]|nr:transcriptional repressor [Oscillibacter sp.]
MEGTQRFSKKRQAIYDALMDSLEHPNAEMVYQSLKADYPDLSLGTVYRNIKGMVQNGDVICVGHVDGKERYDAHLDPHVHLVCRGCGSVVDIPLESALEEQCKTISQTNGIEMDVRSLHFAGLCNTCKSERNS